MILDLYLVWRIHNIRNQNISLIELNKYYEDRLNIIQLNLSLTFELQSSKIDKNTVFFDENEKEIKIAQIVSRGPYLIFKYSNLNCEVCVDEQISLLKYAKELIGVTKILIITNYSSYGELSRFQRLNQLDDFKILNLKNNELTSVDKSFPYYFILDESYSLKQLYVPIRGDSLITKEYFNNSLKKYF